MGYWGGWEEKLWISGSRVLSILVEDWQCCTRHSSLYTFLLEIDIVNISSQSDILTPLVDVIVSSLKTPLALDLKISSTTSRSTTEGTITSSDDSSLRAGLINRFGVVDGSPSYIASEVM